LLIERHNDRMAAIRLQELLNRYPATPRQHTIRLQLADCYRRLAAQDDVPNKAAIPSAEDSTLQLRQQRRRWLQSAVAHYQKIVEDLSARAATGPLPQAEEAILLQALTAAAECHFEQRQYAEAISYFEELSSRCRHAPEGLKALKQVVR